MTKKWKKVTTNDIRKEKVIASLPFDVQRSIVDKAEKLLAEQTATPAEMFFDKEGKPLQPPSSAMVNNFDTSSQAPLETDEEEEVNAKPFQRNQQ